jgi:antitoxin component YwqK of YwqJK toxin-antitoxin module
MRTILTFILLLVLFSACLNNQTKNSNDKEKSDNDSIQIIRNPYKNNPKQIEYEIPILKGTKLRHGIQKRYYAHGSLYSEIPYTRNVKTGTAFTYYQAYNGAKPVVWKEQRYVNGKLEGLCKRYHKDGKLQAEYYYKQGHPMVGLKEYGKTGKLITQPNLILTKRRENGMILVKARMSNNKKKVKYYTGKLIEGKYLPKNLKEVQVKNGVGEILESAFSGRKSITVTAVMSTGYYNKYVTSKTISLK